MLFPRIQMLASFLRCMTMPTTRLLTYGIAVVCCLAACVAGSLPVVAQQDMPGAVQPVVERGTAAGLDVDLLRDVVRRAESNGAGAAEIADLLNPAVRLAESGLPAEPVLNKTLEGLAKRVPAPRVQSVVGQLATNIQDAGPLVDSWLERSDVRSSLRMPSSSGRDRLIVSAAHAAQRGVAASEVQKLLDEIPALTRRREANRAAPSTQDVAAAVRAMAEVPNAAQSPALARSLVASALSAGFSADEVGQLPAALRRAQDQTRQPLPALTRGVAQAIARGVPATDVLRGLYQGRVANVPAAANGRGPGKTPPPGQGKPPDAGKPPDTPPGKPPGDPPGGGKPPDTPPGGGPPGGNVH